MRSRSLYLYGNNKREQKLWKLKRKGWLDQPDQHVIDWLRHINRHHWHRKSEPGNKAVRCPSQ